jgi:hypothetical protein
MNARSIFIALLIAGTLLPSSCIPAETVVTIVSPSEGAKVDQFVTIDGESQLLPANTVIWVVVYLPVTGRYYPQNFPADVQANGEWSSTAYIGQQNESGLDADIIAVVADGSAQNAFKTYLLEAKDKNDFSGLERLPKGATIYDRVSVVRR